MSLFQPLWQPAETTAEVVPFTPVGTISAKNVQAAIEELDTKQVAANYLAAIAFGALI